MRDESVDRRVNACPLAAEHQMRVRRRQARQSGAWRPAVYRATGSALPAGCLLADGDAARGSVAACVLLLSLTSCSTLATQQRMQLLVRAALRTCKQDGARCAAAQRCSRAALQAAEALQRERETAARGQPAGADAIAADTLPAVAEASCKAGGITP